MFPSETDSRRPSAKEVLDHPFMKSEDDGERQDLVWKRGEPREEPIKEESKEHHTAATTTNKTPAPSTPGEHHANKVDTATTNASHDTAATTQVEGPSAQEKLLAQKMKMVRPTQSQRRGQLCNYLTHGAISNVPPPSLFFCFLSLSRRRKQPGTRKPPRKR